MWELQCEAHVCEGDAEKKQRDALRMRFRNGVGRAGENLPKSSKFSSSKLEKLLQGGLGTAQYSELKFV